MKKERVIAILNVTFISIIIIFTILSWAAYKRLVGPILLIFFFAILLILKLFGVNPKAVWPDIVFGFIDNGVLVLAAVMGADFGGVLGAVLGGTIANVVTDGYAGIFEGWTAEYMRIHKIKEERTALTSALGKMAGCLLGAGAVLVILWSILNL